jgi:hypothetical protein
VQAEWKSPSAVLPSPSQVAAMRLSPLIALAIAHPTACGVCVARLPLMVKNECSRLEYMIGSWRPFSLSARFE